jgi:hypothetical protein
MVESIRIHWLELCGSVTKLVAMQNVRCSNLDIVTFRSSSRYQVWLRTALTPLQCRFIWGLCTKKNAVWIHGGPIRSNWFFRELAGIFFSCLKSFQLPPVTTSLAKTSTTKISRQTPTSGFYKTSNLVANGTRNSFEEVATRAKISML